MKNMKIISLIIIAICLFKISSAEEINENWIKNDSIFINQVKKSFLTNPLSIEKDLEPWENARVNLGYGYTMIEHSMGKGYVSIFYTFIYKDYKLVSYYLKPQMPHDTRLTKRYLSFYKGLFEIENDKAQNLFFGYKEVSKPIGDIENELITSDDVKFLMTPYSGVIYGNSGGIANEILDNRKAFNMVKNSITEDLLIVLLKSINPATRLCAAELFFTKMDNFRQKELIKKQIEKNIKELPKITTMSGDIILYVDSRKVLNEMINENK